MRQPQKIYGMMHPEIKGCIQFTFNAIDQADADDKAFSWNRYHSFTGSSVFTAAEIPADHIAATWPLNNNYVRF